MHRLMVVVLVHCLVALIWPTPAAIAQLPDWSSLLASGDKYASSDGRERAQVREHSDSDLAQIAQSVTALELPDSATVLKSSQRGSGPAIVVATIYQSASHKRMLSVSVAQRKGGGALSLAHSIDPTLPNAASRLSDGGAALLMAAMQGQSLGDVPGGQAAQRGPSEPASVAIAPRSSARRAGGLEPERILFDLSYKYGVGGAAYPVYKPVVLFKGGVACKCLESAIGDIDVDATRRAHPKRVGTWRRQGGDYEVRWAGASKPKTLKVKTGPPTPLPDAGALRGKYQKISGGGNTALGGTVMTANVEDLHFFGDGSFAQSNARLMQSNAAVVSGKRGKAGVWSLDGSTLRLSYADGREVGTTVFYSGKRKRTANFGRYGVLWIGGEGFKRVE